MYNKEALLSRLNDINLNLSLLKHKRKVARSKWPDGHPTVDSMSEDIIRMQNESQQVMRQIAEVKREEAAMTLESNKQFMYEFYHTAKRMLPEDTFFEIKNVASDKVVR